MQQLGQNAAVSATEASATVKYGDDQPPQSSPLSAEGTSSNTTLNGPAATLAAQSSEDIDAFADLVAARACGQSASDPNEVSRD